MFFETSMERLHGWIKGRGGPFFGYPKNRISITFGLNNFEKK